MIVYTIKKPTVVPQADMDMDRLVIFTVPNMCNVTLLVKFKLLQLFERNPISPFCIHENKSRRKRGVDD